MVEVPTTARQLGSHVDLVRHHFQVERVARGRIDVLRLVAQNAHLHSMGMAAMEGQLVVAGVAALGADHIARNGDRRTIGDKIEGGAGVVRAKVERREIAVAVDRDRGSVTVGSNPAGAWARKVY